METTITLSLCGFVLDQRKFSPCLTPKEAALWAVDYLKMEFPDWPVAASIETPAFIQEAGR